MISYSTNWMGPIATRWYEERDIPFEIRETSGKILPKTEYKHFLESYSCGRIDSYRAVFNHVSLTDTGK